MYREGELSMRFPHIYKFSESGLAFNLCVVLISILFHYCKILRECIEISIALFCFYTCVLKLDDTYVFLNDFKETYG